MNPQIQRRSTCFATSVRDGDLCFRRLDVLLAGDANSDFKVDNADTTLILQLDGKKKGDARYSPTADVDRNGVINGGDRQRAVANKGAVFVAPESNPLELSLPAGALALVDASPDTYVNRTGGLVSV